MTPKLVFRESEMTRMKDICGEAIDLINSETTSARGLSIATIYVEPGKRSTRHFHKRMEEIYYFIEGTGRVSIGDDVYDVGPGSACYIPINMLHQIENIGSSTLKLVSVDSPSFDPMDTFQ
jgi:mannose-6-phosphate isomerase-like protein (cupin superfamily)